MDESKDCDADADDPWDLQVGHGTHVAGMISRDLQASHRTHVAGMIYAREFMEGYNSIISCREKFPRVSHVWRWFLGFPSAHQVVGMSGRAKCTRGRYGGSIYEGLISYSLRVGTDVEK